LRPRTHQAAWRVPGSSSQSSLDPTSLAPLLWLRSANIAVAVVCSFASIVEFVRDRTMSVENNLADRVALLDPDPVMLSNILQFQGEDTTMPARVAPSGVAMFQSHPSHTRIESILGADVGGKIEHFHRFGEDEGTREQNEAIPRRPLHHPERLTIPESDFKDLVGEGGGFKQDSRSQSDIQAGRVHILGFGVENHASLNEFQDFVAVQDTHRITPDP